MRKATQGTKFNRLHVKFSDIPIDALYNKKINKLKATELIETVTQGSIPIEF